MTKPSIIDRIFIMEEILYLTNPWWSNKAFEVGVWREKYLKQMLDNFNQKLTVLLVGSRRVGKTTLFYQVVSRLIQKGVPPQSILYLLLDHPQFSNAKIAKILREYRKIHNRKRDQWVYLFLDEVQYSPNWEQEVKAIYDTENVKMFLSGSASTLILRKGAFLTGRYVKIKVDPLDFEEFVNFRQQTIVPTEPYRFEKLLTDYLKIGGYPEYALTENPKYLTDLLEGVIFKDIVSLFGIRNPDIVRDLLGLLADRVGYQTSFLRLAKILGVSVDTVKEYISYLKAAFVLDEHYRYSSTRSKRIYAAKKFYLNDNGLLLHLAGKFNQGSAAEQTLFSYLNRKYPQLGFYYENQKEADFVLQKGQEKIMIESKFVDKIDLVAINKQMKEAIESLRPKKVVVVTQNQEQLVENLETEFSFLPLWKVLTNQTSL